MHIHKPTASTRIRKQSVFWGIVTEADELSAEIADAAVSDALENTEVADSSTQRLYESEMAAAQVARACEGLTVCDSNNYETQAPTGERDHTCSAWKTCSGGEYESGPPDSTKDRICTALTDCLVGEYQFATGTTTGDRTCKTATTCSATTQYEISPLTPTNDRICGSYAPSIMTS